MSARIAHIGIAVRDLETAAAFYRDVLGVTPSPAEFSDGARIVSVPFGDATIELLEPEREDSPVAKFLAKRGPGIHHICYRVPDLHEAIDACRSHGYQLVDENPRAGIGGHRIVFLHPSGTGGALVELTE